MEKNKYAQKEEEILKFWNQNKIFERSVTSRPADKPYVFYDGPPFATGLPHYGHILASTLKDVFPRYQTMQGKRVERRWGWDCHGLPIENIAEKELGIKTKKQIEEFGVDKFNEFCRSKVLEYAEAWKAIIGRLGRWVDMDDPYSTMDLSYMESVWWVFKQLWDKGLIYEGYHSMHICPRCETTLSQSEVAEGYKNIKDLSVIAKFHLLPGQKFAKDHETKDSVFILAWTTTPWTLIGNVALAVGENISYSALRIKDVPELLIIATDRIDEVIGDNEIEMVHRDLKGSDLIGLKYEPLFDFEKNMEKSENGWKVVPAEFVTTEDGTGVVHIAPAFGEDDMNLAKKLNLPFIQHIGMDGVIKPGYGEFSGLSVKPTEDIQSTDVAIIKYLAKMNLLFDKAQYEHSYPHCWRCETPLLNYATSSWFVAVEKIKVKALELAKDIEWMPKHIKEGRFGNWLEGARDWSISRQRYWASVIPIWVCDKNPEHKNVIGSVAELEQISGKKVSDLHKHIIDKVTFPCEKCDGEMHRIPDVLDTWFDSGSMPYAQIHYPFDPSSISSQCSKNYNAGSAEGFNPQECPPKGFPAEFIGEGIDQTRAWFYYLHILSTAIMQKNAFNHAVVNGIVLAEDGKKMSKRLNNYPDPVQVLDQYCADSLRFYLMNSVVMLSDNLAFNEKDLREIYNKVINTLYNILSFYNIYKDAIETKDIDELTLPVIDKYIISRLENTKAAATNYLNEYNTVKYSREIRSFIDDLSLWWVRRSRERLRDEDINERVRAFSTLRYVLREFSLIIAPLIPFVAESIWQKTKDANSQDSVHLALLGEINKDLMDEDLEKQMNHARQIVELGHSIRSQAGIKVRQPLSKISFNYDFGENTQAMLGLILPELNIESFDDQFVQPLESQNKDLKVVLETKIDDRLKSLGDLRELTRMIQSMRKKKGLEPSDTASLEFHGDASAEEFLNQNSRALIKATNLSQLDKNQSGDFEKLEISSGMIYFRLK